MLFMLDESLGRSFSDQENLVRISIWSISSRYYRLREAILARNTFKKVTKNHGLTEALRVKLGRRNRSMVVLARIHKSS